MTEMTIKVRDSLAPQIHSFGNWLSTIIELAAANFKTSALQRASAELIEFLSNNPTPQEVLNYKISDAAQQRASFLLSLNSEGKISQVDDEELDEWEKFNHVYILLVAQAAKLLRI